MTLLEARPDRIAGIQGGGMSAWIPRTSWIRSGSVYCRMERGNGLCWCNVRIFPPGGADRLSSDQRKILSDRTTLGLFRMQGNADNMDKNQIC